MVFIDMRGALGDLISTEGDMNYDLSKVYQSLRGYDFFILDKDIDHNAARLLRDLEEVNLWFCLGKSDRRWMPSRVVLLYIEGNPGSGV